MKKTIIKTTAIVSFCAIAILNSGCGKISDFGDTNLSPNGVPEPILSGLLANVENAIPGTLTTQAPSMFCQYFAESTYPGISKYSGLQLEASGTYSGLLQDAQVIIDKCSDPTFAAKAAKYGDVNSQIAIATLLKTYTMWTLTDRWGDLPYSEALGGAKNLLPKYDAQKDIYAKLLADIQSSLSLLNPNGTVAGDLVYGGNTSKWGKFANSLRMLIAIRMSKRYPNAGELAATEFNKSLTNSFGYIATNADNFSIAYPGGVYPNPFNALNISQDVAVALTFTDALNGMGDTRRASMASTTNGCPYGLANAAPIGTPYARTFNSTFAAQASTLVIVNAASVLLAKAEAIERGWVSGLTTADAKVAYDQGVAASFAQWGQTMPATYLSGGAADYTSGTGVGAIGGSSVAGSNGTTNSALKRIALQQWIAFYPAGIQGWSNWRRTGVPDLKPTIFFTNTGGQIPRRYAYGSSDYTTNGIQVKAAVAKIPGGADSQDARMWWDQ